MKELVYNEQVSATQRGEKIEILHFAGTPEVEIEEDVTHSVHLSFSDDVVVSITPAAADALRASLQTALSARGAWLTASQSSAWREGALTDIELAEKGVR